MDRRTRLVFHISPCAMSDSVPNLRRVVPRALASKGSTSPTKQDRRRHPESLLNREKLRHTVRGPEAPTQTSS